MKTLNQIENIILTLFLTSIVIFGILHKIPDSTLQMLRSDYQELNLIFNPFWNYKFLLILRPSFLLIVFVWTRKLFVKIYNQESKNNKNIAYYMLQVGIAAGILVLLELTFDLRVKIELLGMIERNSKLDFNVLFYSIAPSRYRFIQALLILKFIISSLIFLSSYFLLVTFFRNQNWRKQLTSFFKINSNDIKISFTIFASLSLFLFIGSLVKSPLIPGSAIFLYLVTLTITYALVLSNIFWLYKAKGRLSVTNRIFYSLGMHLYASIFIIAVLYTSLDVGNIHVGMHMSLNYLLNILQAFPFILLTSHTFSAIYFFIRRKAIVKHAHLIQNLTVKTSELALLKSQINPHFLFNSLNSLYSLALAESSPKTSTGIQKLSDMMRFMLRENVEDKIEVSRELEYIENYIELQKLRIEGNDKVKLDYQIDKACEGSVTPMLIIPFIENAFKHGVSTHYESWISIVLKCTGDEIHLNVKNSNHQKKKTTKDESGIGLENVRQRLVLLYPEKHLFQIFEQEDSFEANLKMELN